MQRFVSVRVTTKAAPGRQRIDFRVRDNHAVDPFDNLRPEVFSTETEADTHAEALNLHPPVEEE